MLVMIRNILTAACLLLSWGLLAHDVRSETTLGRAARIRFSYSDGKPLAYESVVVTAPDSAVEFQTGRTDRAGRFAFLPDSPGTWKVRVSTRDGHGTTATLVVHDEEAITPKLDSWYDQFPRLAAGLGWLLGVFGILAIWRTRKRS